MHSRETISRINPANVQMNWCINCVLTRVMERRERDNSYSFTAFHYPHQHTVDTPVCLPPRRRSQPSSLKSWHYTYNVQMLETENHLNDAEYKANTIRNFRVLRATKQPQI